MEEQCFVKYEILNQQHADILQAVGSAISILKEEKDDSLRKFLYDSRHGFCHCAENHIRHEEKLFAKHQMPTTFIDLQRKDHGRLMLLLIDFFESLKSDSRYSIVDKGREIYDELYRHMAGVDTEMNNYIKD